MDDIKDAQKTDIVSKFLDSHNVRVNPFGDNRAADRAYRRAERIVAAVHLLTNHIDARESIRSELRSGSTSLLASMLEIRDEMRSSQSGSLNRTMTSIRYLISLVRMLAIGGFASVQNVTAVTEALDDLGTFLIASQRTNFSENVSITREELLDVGQATMRMPQNVVRERKDITRTALESSVPRTGADVSNQETAFSGERVSARSHNILEILKTSGTLGIKDICANLPEYSEKMIQRELLGLVQEGKVLKTGLKRWSRYSLAS